MSMYIGGIIMNRTLRLGVTFIVIVPIFVLPASSEATVGALRVGGISGPEYSEEHGFVQKVVCRRVTTGVARLLEKYAAALRKDGNMAEAARINKHAKTLRKPSTGSGRYLGFSPADELEAYAKFLLAHGDPGGAKTTKGFADRWTYSNLTGAC